MCVQSLRLEYGGKIYGVGAMLRVRGVGLAGEGRSRGFEVVAQPPAHTGPGKGAVYSRQGPGELGKFSMVN